MANLADAILFAILIAAAGLGVTSIIVSFLPRPETDDRRIIQRKQFELGFFGAAGIVIALLMWYALTY